MTFKKLLYCSGLTILFIFIVPQTFYAQDELLDQKIDSLLVSIKTTETNQLENVKKLVTFAGRYRYTPSTKKLIDRAISIAEESNHDLSRAHTLYSLGNFYYFNANIDSCLTNLENAQKLAKKENDQLLHASILTTKGGAYNKLGAIILAISTQIEAKNVLDNIDSLKLNIDDKKQLKGKRLVINNSLANLYSKTEDYTAAVEFYDRAYKAAIALNSIPNASIILGNKGDLLLKTNQLEEGLNVLENSKAMRKENGLPQRYIANTDLLIGRAHYKMNNLEEAAKSFNDALLVYERGSNQSGIMQTLIQRGLLKIKEQKISEALIDCTKGKELALEQNDNEYLIKACNCLYQGYKLNGNTALSLENHEQYMTTRDSVFNEKNIRKITQVGMQYEFDKKEAEKNLAIEKKNQQKNLMLIGFGLLLLMTSAFLMFYRKRLNYQKTIAHQNKKLHDQKIIDLTQKNKLVAMNSMIEGQEKERLRIAKDLHDGLGGLLSSVKLHYNSVLKEKNEKVKTPLTEKTNNLIDEACVEVRRISHNMMPHAISISGLEGALQDITTRLNDQGFNATFETNDLPKLEPTKEVMIYRLIQELVSNIRKHAIANNIIIQLFGFNNQLQLIIEDDGKGFDYVKALTNGGLGIKSINSRIAFLDGSINWDTQPGRGTNINANIPIQ